MPELDRRAVIVASAVTVVVAARPPDAIADPVRGFITEAERMRHEAVARGDQPFGAVVVLAGAIVGYGPSRVVTDGDADAHAERVALADAQRRLGRHDLSGAVIYATSRPCAACQRALAAANLSRMFVGPDGIDAGLPAR